MMKGHLPTLDGWRAVAVLGVLVHHATASLVGPAGPFPNSLALHASELAGNRAVDIFFALSGFLICTRLLQEARERGSISLPGFYVRRFFRILPPYLLYLAVLSLIARTGAVAVDGEEWLACLLFVRNYLLDPPTSAGWYTGHFWSLSVEEHFYIFWPLLLVAFGNRRALAVAGFLALAVAGWRELDGAFHLISLSHVTRRTDTCADALLWGCWAALMLNDAARREWVTRWLTPGVWAVLVLVELAVIVGHPPLGGLVQTFLMPWLLVGTVLRPSTAVGRFLERPWLSWLGRLSYSLYLWQQLFFIGSPHLGRPYPLGWIQDLPLNLAAALGCSAASYYLVERPMIGMGQRLARSLQRPATALTPVTPVGVV